jgi:hypothetical protein
MLCAYTHARTHAHTHPPPVSALSLTQQAPLRACSLAPQCASLGVRFERTDDDEARTPTPTQENFLFADATAACGLLTWHRRSVRAREPQAYMWEDDYHEVVTEDEDGWGREAMLVEGDASADASPLAPPPWLSGATTNAPAAGGGGVDGGAPGALRSAYSPEQGFRRVRTRGATAAARAHAAATSHAQRDTRTRRAPSFSLSLISLSLISSPPACGGAERCLRASFARAWRRRRRRSS